MPISATALTTILAAREYVLRDATDDSQDGKLKTLIDSYSVSIYRYTGRQWHPEGTSSTKRFSYDGSGFLSLEPYELRTVGTVTMWADQPTADQQILDPGSSTERAEFYLGPAGGTTEGTYTFIDIPTVYCPPRRGVTVSVSGTWGISSIPADVELACLVAVKAAYVNPEGFSARSLGELTFTEELTAAPSDTAGNSLPQSSRNLLVPYRRAKVLFA